jgi:signal transduction histidine kinase
MTLNIITDYLKDKQSEPLIYVAKNISDYITKKTNTLDTNNNFDASSVKNFLSDNYKKYETVILDLTGNIFVSSFDIDSNLKKTITNKLSVLSNDTTLCILDKNRLELYVLEPIVGTNLEKIGTVMIVNSAKDIFTSVNKIRQRLLYLIIFICLVVIGLIVPISNLIIEPLKKILSVIDKISSGQLNQRIHLNKHDEFSQLAVSFNRMTGKLQQTENIREEFVSNVSHELKTPLSAIKILCETMLDNDNLQQDIQKEFLSDINSEINRMTNIINDLLTLVKLDRKRFPLNISETNLNNMLQSIIKRLLPLATKNNIEIEFIHDKNIIFKADETKLSLAISNLIDNAIKYTQSGGKIKIFSSFDNDYVYIKVQDNGIGINKSEQNKIFERFYRVDKTRDRETGGTGLGLAISQSAIIMHNGNITLTSEEGLGTTFLITIPKEQNLK